MSESDLPKPESEGGKKPGPWDWLRQLFQIRSPSKEEGSGTDGASLGPRPQAISQAGEKEAGEGVNVTPTLDTGASGGMNRNEQIPPK